MASLKLININKIYDNHVQAVFDFNLEINDKDFIVFVGPSGCGKSTTLRMIAGLEDISSGELYIDDVYSNDVPAKNRDIAMVFQNYALYPHMTVYENMAFGLRNRHVPKEEIDRRIKEAAEILDITDYLKRKPKALSGGQCQRVALGRAIVRKAKVFLMDEPLSNLDAKLRVAMRSEIIKLHERTGATTIYVTHDQTEAMTMANRIVVMKKGYIQQIGTPKEIYEHPNNQFVASFIGSPAMNFIDVKIGPKLVNAYDAFKFNGEEFYPLVKKHYQEKLKSYEEKLEKYEEKKQPYQELCQALEEAKKEEKDVEVKEKELNKFIEANPEFVDLKKKYDRYVNICEGVSYPAVLGIRPEDVVLTNVNRKILSTEADVIEMMGDVLLIHSNVCGKEFIAKTSSNHEISSHQVVYYTFQNKKIHLFDVVDETAMI